MKKEFQPTEVVFQCRLPLSSVTLTLVTDLLRGHLRKINSRWRKLDAGRMTVIVLAHLHCAGVR
ncbi:hypothetical protein [Streptomyces sp. SD15]